MADQENDWDSKHQIRYSITSFSVALGVLI
ncbi:hypothetical protein RCH20_002522 [Psychrobacter sp. PL15]|nr:hypothetical protein [Psychrobacter sp. PL15]MEC5211268.1 hypothetical protein [Psychrobacter sp. PL15]MEC5211438.1 hypothetical protein [Psychrobacter sp. PL15]